MKRSIDIRKVPAPLVEKVTAEAEERDVSVTDVVVEIVARRYGLAWEPSGYPYVAAGGSDHWNLRVPRVMYETLKGHASAMPNGTITGCVLLALSDHYGLPAAPPTRRVVAALTPGEVAEARKKHEDGASLRSLAREYGVKRETLTKAIRGGVAA